MKYMFRYNLWILISLTLLLAISCKGNKVELTGENLKTEGYDIINADRFLIKTLDAYTELTIKSPWQGAINVHQISYLVPRGSQIPEGLDPSIVIFVPLKSIICMSTTHLAMISALGEEESISGFSGNGYVFSENIANRVKNGHIHDIGFEASLNKELIILIDPDLIMMYGIGSESAAYISKIKELGIRVVFNADYLETDPLSKTEWIKLFGALYCKEEMADSIYNSELKS